MFSNNYEFPFQFMRRVFNWITQRVLLTFALVKLLVFATLFNAPKKRILNYFVLEMAAIVVARRHHREQRVLGKRERIFSTRINLFGMSEEHIIRTYRLLSHVIFNLLQEIKDDLEPSTIGVTQYQVYQNFLQPFIFWPPVLVNILWLYSLFAITLICAALGILRWLICKWDVVSVFFNLCVVSKSPAEISTAHQQLRTH